VGGERELRENLGFQLGEKAVSFFFFTERGEILLSDLNVRGGYFA